MRIEALIYLYRRRLRTHPIQELLAGLGIAVGVALAFAVMVANSSIAGSAGEIVHGVTGRANLQLSARDTHGFDERLVQRVRALPGVVRAAPLLEQRAVLVGPNGRELTVDVAGLDPSLAALSGRVAGNFVAGGLRLLQGVLVSTAAARLLALPDPAAEAVMRPIPSIRLELRGRAERMSVAAVVGRETIGATSTAPIAILPLARLQQLSRLPGRITRILVETRPGPATDTRAALAALARRAHITLSPADAETHLLARALRPSDQATGFFAGISALLGLLLAFNAMLLTAPERRRTLAELRISGFKPAQLMTIVLFQALVLGIVASALGVVLGDVLSRHVFNGAPGYLSPAFTFGDTSSIGLAPVALALAGGIITCCLAATPQLLDLRRSRAVDAVFHGSGSPGNGLSPRIRQRLLAVALAAAGAASAMLLLAPAAALPASALLAVATVCATPSVVTAVIGIGERVAANVPRLSMLAVAMLALRATTLRSLALAATGAVAVFGSVAIGGARQDLLRGIAHYTDDYVGTADAWVVNAVDNQATNDFRSEGRVRRVAAVPGVAEVRRYHGGFLDIGDRRVWLIARPPGDPAMLPASQLVHGSLATASARMRAGGWVTLSDRIAADRHIGIGDAVTLPTPSGPVRFRLAATTTNLGWPPGAAILNAVDYRRAWKTQDPTALEIALQPGAPRAATLRRISAALGPDAGLEVQSAAARGRAINASARQGLERLVQISLLLLGAAVLATTAAMGAAIWQRRASLAALRIQSFAPRQLWHMLLVEASVVVGAGCFTGAVIGVYGQLVIDRYLRLVTGFPVSSQLAGWPTLETFSLVVAAALAVVAIPGWLASRVPPAIGLQD